MIPERTTIKSILYQVRPQYKHYRIIGTKDRGRWFVKRRFLWIFWIPIGWRVEFKDAKSHVKNQPGKYRCKIISK